MKIEVVGVSAPVWGDEAKTVINLNVKFAHLSEEVEFTASRDDQSEHGRILWERAVFGEFGEIAAYSGPTEQELAEMMFPEKRAKLLMETEAKIAPLARAARLGLATDEELVELTALELYTIELMRAEGPALPARV